MIRFAKYHGCGNSFVIVREKDVRACDLCVLAEKMCSEHTGIGADGFMAVKTEPGLEMIFYNRDGSRAPMCGNGIRCFAKFCYDERICTDRQFPVETLADKMIVETAEEIMQEQAEKEKWAKIRAEKAAQGRRDAVFSVQFENII